MGSYKCSFIWRKYCLGYYTATFLILTISYLRTSKVKAMMKNFHLTILLLSLVGLCQVAEGCCGQGKICTGSCFNGCSGTCINGTNGGGCPGGCPKGQFCVWKTCHPYQFMITQA